MKLATYSTAAGATPSIGIVSGDTIIDSGYSGSMTSLMEAWDSEEEAFKSKLEMGGGVSIASVKLHAPIQRPGKIWAIGLNYADHIEESGLGTPEKQVWFTKAVTSTNGPYDPVLIARDAPYVDYEIELVAVIGTRGKYIREEDAHKYVFGYCVGNDVTERMWQHSGPQWSLGKSFDTHAPIGPWITTSDEVAEPHNLNLKCFVNSDQRQSSNTKHLVFDIWQQISHLSQAMTLEPGDLIFTGTPGGIGAVMDPRQFLKAGDVVRCEIEGLGHIENVVADDA